MQQPTLMDCDGGDDDGGWIRETEATMMIE